MRYPLSWPAGWPRTPVSQRRRASFNQKVERKNASGTGTWKDTVEVTVEVGRKRLADELERLNASNVVLSTNIELRADGYPRSGRREPEDQGVAVYFDLNGKAMSLACDKWDRIGDNMAALAKHIEAIRGMDRWGVGSVQQAFAGYEALPAPKTWKEVLGLDDLPDINIGEATIANAYRSRANRDHPDKPGGSHDKMAALNAARDEGLRLVAARGR